MECHSRTHGGGNAAPGRSTTHIVRYLKGHLAGRDNMRTVLLHCSRPPRSKSIIQVSTRTSSCSGLCLKKCQRIHSNYKRNSPRPRPKRSEVPIRIPSIPHLLIPSPLTPTPQKGPPPPPLPRLPPPSPPCGCCHTISIYIYIELQKKFVYAQTLSLFTPQTLHPDILRKQTPQTWHHVFLPTYGRAEADDAQRLKLNPITPLLNP